MKRADTNKKLTISVLIAAFNAEGTIRRAIESALNQTVCADEIIVMDDGSTDNTGKIAASYVPRVSVLRQSNKGVSAARNALLQKASGDLIALLDADDIWHRQYLEIQSLNCQNYPNAVASFTGFHNIYDDSQISNCQVRIVDWKSSLHEPLEFLELYGTTPGIIIPSFCVIKADVFHKLGENPYPIDLRSTDDVYLWYRIALLGPFVRSYVKVGFYQILQTSLSHDRISNFEYRVKTFAKVHDIYSEMAPPPMLKLVKKHRVSNYRQAAKYQMGVKNIEKARRHLLDSLRLSVSLKSLVLLIFTFLPRFLQPKWPNRYRAL